MNFKNLRISFLTIALVGFGLAGCNENPNTPPVDDIEAVTNLMASSGDGEVTLTWTASTTSGVVYEIAVDGTAIDSDVTGTAITVTSLTNGTPYEFSVTAVDASDSDERSAEETLTWAPADRYSADADEPTQQLRIYEKQSANGSGLVIDTRAPFSGPANVSLSSSQPIGELSRAQLALFVDSDNTAFRFGPASGFSLTDYQNRASFDQTTVISETFTLVDVDAANPENSFDNWYLDQPLSSFFSTNRTTAFANLTDRSDSKGYGFIVRTGATAAAYHYARVIVVPNTTGKILQGSGNEQYITLVVSYQNAINVPYAKK